MRESSTYQAILEEGRAEGRVQGRTEGRIEGRAEGAVAEARKLLRLLGDKRFGPPDARTAAAIDRIKDLARLEDMLTRMLTVGSWSELLGRPAGRRGQSPATSP